MAEVQAVQNQVQGEEEQRVDRLSATTLVDNNCTLNFTIQIHISMQCLATYINTDVFLCVTIA